jgi:hypothetical protein
LDSSAGSCIRYSISCTVRTRFSLTPTLSLKNVILKNDVLLVFQKRHLRLDTKSKCQYDNEVHRQKNSHIDDDLISVLKNSHVNDTYSQGYYFQTKSTVRTSSVRRVGPVKVISCNRYPISCTVRTSTVRRSSVRNLG